jgi:transposase
MDFSNLIIKALGLQDVLIEKFEFDQAKLSLKLFVRQDRASCRCHHCGNQIGYVHEWKERSVRAPPFGAFLYVEVILFQLRGYCLGCDDKIRSAHIPFLYPEFETLTYSFCEFAGRLMEEMPCEAVARFLKASSKTLWSLDQSRMVKLKPLMKLPENIDLEKMSGDEVHFRTMPKENSFEKPEIKYVTNLVCYAESKVLANAPGRSQKSLLTCLRQLSPEQLAKIKYFSLDMHEPFIRAVRKLCPDAKICIDRFHLAEYANNIFDDVRKSEFRKAKESKDEFQLDMLAPHRRFVLVEREKMLSKKDIRMLDKLKEINKNILNGMILVEHFHSILDKIDVEEFRKSLLLWYRLVREAKLKPFKKMALLIRKYRTEIESYITSRLTSAKSEGLNNKIKVLRRSAYGYTNETSYLNKILQRCGYLNSTHIDTTGWFWGPFNKLAPNTPFY